MKGVGKDRRQNKGRKIDICGLKVRSCFGKIVENNGKYQSWILGKGPEESMNSSYIRLDKHSKKNGTVLKIKEDNALCKLGKMKCIKWNMK